MLLAVVGSTGYKIVLALHIIAVIIGFGGVALSGIHTRLALENQGPTGGAIASALGRVVGVAEYAIYVVPLLGVGLVTMSGGQAKGGFGFGDPWISASFLLTLIAIGLYVGVLRPAQKRFEVAVADAGQVAEAKQLGRMVAIVSGVANLLWVVVVLLMVIKPFR